MLLWVQWYSVKLILGYMLLSAMFHVSCYKCRYYHARTSIHVDVYCILRKMISLVAGNINYNYKMSHWNKLNARLNWLPCMRKSFLAWKWLLLRMRLNFVSLFRELPSFLYLFSTFLGMKFDSTACGPTSSIANAFSSLCVMKLNDKSHDAIEYTTIFQWLLRQSRMSTIVVPKSILSQSIWRGACMLKPA